MPTCCAVIKCGNRSDRDKKSFFRLPNAEFKGIKKRLNEERRKKWLLAIRRADLTENKLKWLRVCEDHFISGKPARLRDVKNPDWVPSQKMGYISKSFHHEYPRTNKRLLQSDNSISDSELQDHDDVKCEKYQYGQTSCEMEDEVIEDAYESYEIEVIEKQTVECQTDVTQQDLYNTEKAYMDTVVELTEIKDKVSKLSISEDSFKNDDGRTKYYTGLQNFATLMLIFNIVQNDLPHTGTSSLSKFQQFILTFMRIKLNLDFTDLSYRFCISSSTVSKAFLTCIHVMYKKLEHFVAWPGRDELIKRLPQSFVESFGHRVAVMIDSFEIIIDRPAHWPPSSQTGSKNCKKIKFLIGICAQGNIVFISSAQEGNTSDQDMLEDCGILEQLLPDDIVICDRGFEIHNQVELSCEVIKIPERIPKGKKMLSGMKVAERKDFYGINFTKHVESVIGKLKQYRILHRTMPLSTFSTNNRDSPVLIDQIVKVCCSLINISSIVIPFD